MDFRILGPLEVEHEGRPVAIGAAKQRAVLAVLVLHANRPVSRDRLIDAVWGDDAPSSAHAALQVYVSGLRKALGASVIRTRPQGYELASAPDGVDAARFERLVAAGGEAVGGGDAEGGGALLRAALDLWRGEPLADLDAVPFVVAERARLEELRLAAVEGWVDAELTLGRHGELVPELRTLVGKHPLRERLRAQLMLALYRNERQAEALEAYREGRRLLAEELGLDPGPGLQQLERAILAQDPALAAPARARRARAPVPPRRSAILLAAAVAAVLAAAMVAAVATRDETRAIVPPNSVAIVDPAGGRVVTAVTVGATPVAVATGFGSAWVATEDGSVSRIDRASERVTATVDVGTTARDIAVGLGRVWVANGAEGVVTRIDPATNTLDAVIRLERGDEEPAPVRWVRAGPDAIWALAGRQLVRIASSGEEARRVTVPAAAGMTVDAASGSVWLVTHDERLVQVDPSTGAIVRTVDLHEPAVAPTASGDSVRLIVYTGHGEIRRVGPSGAIETVGPAADAYLLDLAVDVDALWTVDTSGTVTRRDRDTGRLVDEITTAPTVRSALAVGEGAVWVAIQRPS